jgi:hypothetical protein
MSIEPRAVFSLPDSEGGFAGPPVLSDVSEEAGAQQPLVVVEYRPSDRRWVVRQEGAKRISSLHASRLDAEHVARRLGRNQRKNVAVKSLDGGVARLYNYATAPRNQSRLVRMPREMT